VNTAIFQKNTGGFEVLRGRILDIINEPLILTNAMIASVVVLALIFIGIFTKRLHGLNAPSSPSQVLHE
jgi:hypothetical protein